MNDLELAVRTIEEILPDMPTEGLQKWQGILTTALVKVEAELNSTMLHRCDVCGEEEYGYRTETPIQWRVQGELTICFRHEDKDIADRLETALKADEEQVKQTAEESLEELMDLI